MSCRHLICLDEVEQGQLDENSTDLNDDAVNDPFTDLLSSGLGYISLQREASLLEAVNLGHEKCVETLLESGADVNTVDRHGNSPISESAAFNCVECLKLLVKAGADVNLRNKAASTPLLRATFQQNSRVQLLIDAGTDVNIADNSGYTPIMVVANRCNYQQVESLLKSGADVKARIMKDGVRYHAVTPGNKIELFAAAYFRKALNTVKVLLAFGAYVNIRIKSGLNALEIALSTTCRESENVIKLLHAAGETTDDAAFFEFEINATTFRRKIDLPDYLLERHSNFTLKDMCREAIRKHLLDINPHLNLFARIPQLGLPTRLCHYLLYDEDLKFSEGELN